MILHVQARVARDCSHESSAPPTTRADGLTQPAKGQHQERSDPSVSPTGYKIPIYLLYELSILYLTSFYELMVL